MTCAIGVAVLVLGCCVPRSAADSGVPIPTREVGVGKTRPDSAAVAVRPGCPPPRDRSRACEACRARMLRRLRGFHAAERRHATARPRRARDDPVRAAGEPGVHRRELGPRLSNGAVCPDNDPGEPGNPVCPASRSCSRETRSGRPTSSSTSPCTPSASARTLRAAAKSLIAWSAVVGRPRASWRSKGRLRINPNGISPGDVSPSEDLAKA